MSPVRSTLSTSAGPVDGSLLQPLRGPETAGFWEGTARGELLVQRCEACGSLRFPPRPLCPSCHSTRRGWQPVSGRGRIWSFAVAHPPLLPAFSELAPYSVAVVEIEEDPAIRLVGMVVVVGANATLLPGPVPEIGAAVEVAFEERGDTVLPAWVLVDPHVPPRPGGGDITIPTAITIPTEGADR